MRDTWQASRLRWQLARCKVDHHRSQVRSNRHICTVVEGLRYDSWHIAASHVWRVITVADCTDSCPQVQQCEQQKRQAQLHMGNRVAQFGGAQMVELCRKLQRSAGRFHRMPIGPLGAVLSPADKK